MKIDKKVLEVANKVLMGLTVGVGLGSAIVNNALQKVYIQEAVDKARKL